MRESHSLHPSAGTPAPTSRAGDLAIVLLALAAVAGAGGACASLPPTGSWSPPAADTSVAVWDSSSRRTARVLEGRGVCGFSPDGRRLALTDSIWDLERGQPLEEDLGGLCRGFSPDGRYVVTTRHDGTGLWDVAGSRALPRLSERWAAGPAWSADGGFLAFANDDRNVEVWDLEGEAPAQRATRTTTDRGPAT